MRPNPYDLIGKIVDIRREAEANAAQIRGGRARTDMSLVELQDFDAFVEMQSGLYRSTCDAQAALCRKPEA